MTAAWIAGSVRARALLHRRLGHGGTGDLAGHADLSAALGTLAAGPYRRGLSATDDLPTAEHAVGETLLWHLRVLAGWQPRAGAAVVRLLAGWFELANIVDHALTLTGAPPTPPYRLGALATAWPQLARTTSPAELRAALAASPWGDPGADSVAAITVAGQVSWAARVAAGVPAAGGLAAGAAAILVARERFLCDRALPAASVPRLVRLLGVDPGRPASLADFTAAVRTAARWALSAVDDPAELWRAEALWWARLRRDGESLMRTAGFGADQVVGVAGLLAEDAWRVRAALQVVALRPNDAASAVFDELA